MRPLIAVALSLIGCQQHAPIGHVLTYEIEDANDGAAAVETANAVDRRLSAISRRPLGEVEVTPKNQVAVGIYGNDRKNIATVKEALERVGHLEFHILANPVDHRKVIEQAKKVKGSDVVQHGRVVARWLDVSPDRFSAEQFEDVVLRDDGKQVLVVVDPHNVTGDLIEWASAGISEHEAPQINFTFNDSGARRFQRLTSANLPDPATGRPRNLGIILDDVLLSAPAIQTVISESGRITGDFTQEEVEEIVAVLNTGALPHSLKLVDERTVPQKAP